MYQVKLNGAIIHDIDVTSEHRLSSGNLSEEVNQIPSFSFSVPVWNPIFSQEFRDRRDIVEVINTMTNETEFEGDLILSI